MAPESSRVADKAEQDADDATVVLPPAVPSCCPRCAPINGVLGCWPPPNSCPADTMSNEFWMVALPNSGDEPDVVLNKIKRATTKEGRNDFAEVERVDLPGLMVGTLDSLMALRYAPLPFETKEVLCVSQSAW